MIRTSTCLAFLLTLGGVFGAGLVQGQEDALRWAERMAPGQVLEVKGITGEIRAVVATGQEAQVVARKVGDRGDFQEVAVEVARSGDHIVFCAVYGSWRHGQGRCDPEGSWTGDEDRQRRNQSIDVEVEYEVRVPAGVEFHAAMISGSVEVEGLRSDVSATTVSGPVRVSTSGRAWANSVSGDLEVRMGELGDQDMDFQTVSGDITLWLPSDLDAAVDFRSISGDLDSDFAISTQVRRGRWLGLTLQGTIGDGGPEISVNTVSGDIRLRRSGS